MGTNRKLIKLQPTKAIGVGPSERMANSIAIGQTEPDKRSVGIGSTKESVHSRPMHFRRKSHMIAGIFSDTTS